VSVSVSVSQCLSAQMAASGFMRVCLAKT
jgi:hypothetical protein